MIEKVEPLEEATPVSSEELQATAANQYNREINQSEIAASKTKRLSNIIKWQTQSGTCNDLRTRRFLASDAFDGWRNAAGDINSEEKWWTRAERFNAQMNPESVGGWL